MKRLFLSSLVSAFTAAAQAAAQTTPAIARYVPSAPDRAHVFVMDSAHILSSGMVAALQDSALALQSATNADVAWVTLPTLGGRTIEEAALHIGRTWHVGPKGEAGDPMRNRGLVVLYVPDKTTTAGPNFRVEVGNGLEGTITDSRSRTITNAMRADLRAKRYDAAYLKGWNAAAALVREDHATAAGAGVVTGRARPAVATPVPRARHGVDRGEVFEKVVLVGLLLVFLIAIIAWVRASVFGKGRVYIGGGAGSGGGWDSRSSDFGSSGGGGSDSGGSDSGGGGDFGGGGGFSGGGSSDSI